MPKARRRPQLPNATPTHVLEELLAIAVAEPTIGCRQVADQSRRDGELQDYGPAVTAEGVLLETERLVLRRFTAEDVNLLVALDGDPAVMRYVTGGAPTPREEVEREVASGIPGRLRAG